MLVRFRPEACLAFEAFILAAFAMWQVQPFRPKSASRASSPAKPVIGRAAKPVIGSAAKPVIGSATITSDVKPFPKVSLSVKKSAVKPVPKVCLWTKTAKQVPRVKDEGKDEMKEECKDEVTDEMQCCSACNSMEEEDEDIEEASLLDQALHAAVTAHEDDKEYLQQTVDEILCVWHDVFSGQERVVSERISWRSCWGRLQSVLGGIYGDLLQGTITSLADESRQKLVYIAGLLRAKLLKQHDKSVLLSRAQELQQCMEELTVAVVDTASWHTRLNELLCYEGGSSAYYTEQTDSIGTELDDANKRL